MDSLVRRSLFQESFHLWIVEKGEEGGHRPQDWEWIFSRNDIIRRVGIKKMEEGRPKVKPLGVGQKMENVAEEKPTTPSIHLVVKVRHHTFSTGHFQDEIGIIDSRDNGQL